MKSKMIDEAARVAQAELRDLSVGDEVIHPSEPIVARLDAVEGEEAVLRWPDGRTRRFPLSEVADPNRVRDISAALARGAVRGLPRAGVLVVDDDKARLTRLQEYLLHRDGAKFAAFSGMLPGRDVASLSPDLLVADHKCSPRTMGRLAHEQLEAYFSQDAVTEQLDFTRPEQDLFDRKNPRCLVRLNGGRSCDLRGDASRRCGSCRAYAHDNKID